MMSARFTRIDPLRGAPNAKGGVNARTQRNPAIPRTMSMRLNCIHPTPHLPEKESCSEATKRDPKNYRSAAELLTADTDDSLSGCGLVARKLPVMVTLSAASPELTRVAV